MWWFALFLMLLSTAPTLGHDHGRTDRNWEKMSDDEKSWLMNLKQPDAPLTSCCGLSDQYWCDVVHVREGKTFCQITDDRDDAEFNRPHVPIGTEIEIPPEKLKWEQDGKPIGNPTGHNILFMGRSGMVFCFIQSTGI